MSLRAKLQAASKSARWVRSRSCLSWWKRLTFSGETRHWRLSSSASPSLIVRFPAQLRELSLRSLYCRSDGVGGRGAAVTNLSYRASFHS
ncbi:hypothetical protein DSD19_13290 [Rhodovulum sp. BSW8]|nr:hypothetical protein DSD19_13290 [Rhodovulum sp. BSW8]